MPAPTAQPAIGAFSLSPAPRALCIHDLACVGRCSLAVAAPALSAQGVQACLLPAALLSTHTGGFGAPVTALQTEFCSDALAHFSQLGIAFDAVYSGYLASAHQTELVLRAFAQNPAALKLTDPCLGDGGTLYSAVSPALCTAMTELCAHADVLVPNVTESAILLGKPPAEQPLDNAGCRALAHALAQRFPQATGLVVTGVCHTDGRTGNVVFAPHETAPPLFLPFDCVPAHYHGTGDLFAAVLLGALLRGAPLADAAQRAAAFVGRAVAATHAVGTQQRLGLQFEPLLGELTACTPPLQKTPL